MNALNPSPLSGREASLKNPLALAFLGDTVWDLLIRQSLLRSQMKAGPLQKAAAQKVNAAAQADAAKKIEPLLNEEELSVFQRAKNAHCRHDPPKNQSRMDYSLATALEAVFGYLYLTGQDQRAAELFHASFQTVTEEETCPKSI